MNGYPWARPIRELGPLDADSFAALCKSGQPAVIRELADRWPAVVAAREGDESFVSYLKPFCGDRPVSAIAGPPDMGGRFFYDKTLTKLNFDYGSTQLKSFLNWLLRDREAPSGHAMAVQAQSTSEQLPGFGDANRLNILPAGVEPLAWLGNRGRVVPHQDPYSNLGVVVAGRRQFTLFPPDQLPNLYPGPFDLTPAGTPVSMVDLADPDLDRFPNFSEAMKAAQTAVLEPGDAIYIPYHWWHEVESLKPVNLFISYWWNDIPKHGGRPYDALLFALYAFKSLEPEQLRVWRQVFDHYVFEANGDPAAHLPPHARGIFGEPTPALFDRMRIAIKRIAETL